MKISEITYQINEGPKVLDDPSNYWKIAKSWMQGNQGSEASVLILGVAGALWAGFKQATKLAGIPKPTAEDLAEYLSQARIGSDPIRKAMFKHFRTGFSDFEDPAGTSDGTDPDYSPYDNDQGTAKGRKDAKAKAKADAEAEAGIDPNQQELFPNRNSPPEPTINLKPGVNPNQVIDRSGDKETWAQKIGRKIPKWPSKSKRKGPMATTGNTARSRKMNKNSLDFAGKSLIAEAPTMIPDNIAKKVIQTAIQYQSRIGKLNTLIIPANAQQPSVNSQQLFKRLKHEMPVDGKDEYDPDSEDPTGDQWITTIAGQIKAMSADQRTKLTTAIRKQDPDPTGEFGTDVPVGYVPKKEETPQGK
jgi:hypothetical protein